MKNRTILIVDDSLVMRLKIEDTLSVIRNLSILQAKDGREALELINENKIDGIILDSLMPRIDGYGVLKELRANQTPFNVIVLTADIQATTKQKYLDLGAQDVLHKPFSKKELLSSVEKFFGIAQTL